MVFHSVNSFLIVSFLLPNVIQDVAVIWQPITATNPEVKLYFQLPAHAATAIEGCDSATANIFIPN